MDSRLSECPFCRKNNFLQGDIIHTTEHAYLIENTFQPGNFLIIPEAHITEVQQLPDGWWADMKESIAVIPGLAADYNISLNIGALAGQTQPHLHFWVIPRTPDSTAPGKGLLGVLQLLKEKQD